MRSVLLFVALMASSLYAQQGANCHEVAGVASTNFIDATETLGTATGDLKGGLGVNVLGISQDRQGNTVFKNHHQWVTDSGDTLFFADADATAFATAQSGLVALDYVDGVNIVGGTGRFDHASGNIAFFGAADLTQGHIVLRYQGQLCLRPVSADSSNR